MPRRWATPGRIHQKVPWWFGLQNLDAIRLWVKLQGLVDPEARSVSPTKSEAVAEVAQALRRHAALLRTLHRKVLRDSLSLAQVAVLQFISERNRSTPSDIAQFTGLTAGTITSLVDGLEREGYLIRTRSTEDRRVVHVALSERAAALLAEAANEAQQEFARMFHHWSLHDMHQFATYLDRLTHAPAAVTP